MLKAMKTINHIPVPELKYQQMCCRIIKANKWNQWRQKGRYTTYESKWRLAFKM